MEFFNKKNQPPENKPKENWRIREWFPDITEAEDFKLKTFNNELIRFNSGLNLVSEKTLPFSDAIHFSDSILGCREIVRDAKPSSIIDIGIGNGFPSIVMATLNRNIKIIVIERDSKKIEFMKHVSDQLKLDNIEFKLSNIENIPPSSLEFVMMRGFSVISKALLLLRKQVKKGGRLYIMKSEEWATEVANIPSQLCTHWNPSLVGEYRLPIGEVKFAVVKLTKITE